MITYKYFKKLHHIFMSLLTRRKNIEITKLSNAYHRYEIAVPRETRTNLDIHTPSIYVSNRKFKGLLRVWRTRIFSKYSSEQELTEFSKIKTKRQYEHLQKLTDKMVAYLVD